MNELQTERLVLRPSSTQDISPLHQLWSNREVRRWLWDDRIAPLEEVTQVVVESERTFEEKGFGLWLVYTSDGALVGFVGLRPPEWASDEFELLYGLHPDHWGQGYATEAARAALRHAFDECNLQRVIAAFDSPNEASGRVLERLGMHFDREGDLDGMPTKFFSLEANDFGN